MADFCWQCTETCLGVPGKDNDMAGITKPETWKHGNANIVLCEGCGYIQVDPEGRCVSHDCLRQHHPSEPE